MLTAGKNRKNTEEEWAEGGIGKVGISLFGQRRKEDGVDRVDKSLHRQNAQ